MAAKGKQLLDDCLKEELLNEGFRPYMIDTVLSYESHHESFRLRTLRPLQKSTR